MALECDTSQNNENKTEEEEEEDLGCYFLQPSSSPYNITEKVQQANLDLFNSTAQTTRSAAKVKFRDELVSFEPELTDDDVNSIESDHVAEEDLHVNADETDLLGYDNNFKHEETILPYNTVLRGGMDMDDIEEEIDEAIYEELVLSDDNEANATNGNDTEGPSLLPEKEAESDAISNRSGTATISSRKSTKKRKKRANKTLIKNQSIHCREHCIERLDSRLSMSIKKLEIHEKPPLVNLPPLHLHQRKCCDDPSVRNLPNYNGYRSEYGLSSRQIQNRNRYVEMIRQKEATRQKLIEEYRALKIQRNEEIFCQWLKEVSRRKNGQHQAKSGSNYSSPDGIANTSKNRPKTAGFLPKTNVKKKRRPHTTQSCVYIEISPGDLKKGIHIGDLLVTNQKELSKKLHILTIS